MSISDHITLAEATKSQTAIRYGIDNSPTQGQLERMRVVANLIFEPVRNYFMKPIAVVSFFRSKKLNTAIGGAINSQHMEGMAMDLDADVFGGLKNKQIFEYIRKYLDFDQLIGEVEKPDGDYEWIHVSYKNNTQNRREVLIGFRHEGKMHYKKFT